MEEDPSATRRCDEPRPSARSYETRGPGEQSICLPLAQPARQAGQLSRSQKSTRPIVHKGQTPFQTRADGYYPHPPIHVLDRTHLVPGSRMMRMQPQRTSERQLNMSDDCSLPASPFACQSDCIRLAQVQSHPRPRFAEPSRWRRTTLPPTIGHEINHHLQHVRGQGSHRVARA